MHDETCCCSRPSLEVSDSHPATGQEGVQQWKAWTSEARNSSSGCVLPKMAAKLAGGIRGSLVNDTRRIFSRFFKCYVSRKGYREGGYGLLIALFAGLYPIISTIKSRVDENR